MHNPKRQQFEQLKGLMVLRSGKEVDNKVSKKEYDKEEGVKTIWTHLKTEKDNDRSPIPIMLDPTVTYKPRVPYPHALDALFPSNKDKQRDDILRTFKQVKVNLFLLKSIR